MHPILKNFLAVLVGLVAGSFANGGIINLGGSIISPPGSADNSTMEGLIVSMHLYEPIHFIFPFLAHALGTFVGAFLTAIIAANHQLKLAFVIGFIFLAGGIYMVASLPSPLWFSVLDLVGSYIPMAFFGGRFALRTKNKSKSETENRITI